MSTRNTLINAIKTKLLTVTSLHADRVHIGSVPAQLLDGTPRAMIVPGTDRPDSTGEDNVKRTLEVFVAVVVAMDESKTTSQYEQLNTAYDTIHAKLEELVQDNVGGNAHDMTESPDGISPLDYNDDDGTAAIISKWNIRYERLLAAT